MAEVIRQTWEEWQSSREAKRQNLRDFGLAFSSRRQHAIGSQENRLRRAFGGNRIPA